MNISIDEKVLEQTKFLGNTLTLPEYLLCLIVKAGYNPEQTLSSLIQKGIIVKDFYNEDKYYIKSGCYEALQDVLIDSDKSIPKITELNELVIKLQELFPKERKCDVNGVPKYAYRGNKTDVANRLQKFFKLYGKYSYDDVLECTKRYVESFKYDKTYMKILPYYIMKDGESQLATELENMDDTPQEIINPNEDWTNTLL